MSNQPQPLNDLPELLSDDEDYWRLNPETGEYHMLAVTGEPYSRHTHPAATYDQLVGYLPHVREATEVEVLWRAVRYVIGALEEQGIA